MSNLTNKLKLKLHVSYHDDPNAQQRVAGLLRQPFTAPTPIAPGVFFESALFAQEDCVVQDKSIDWVGHVAYSYTSKIKPFCFEALVAKYAHTHDVIALHPDNPLPLLSMAELNHPGFTPIWLRLCTLLGHDYNTIQPPPTAFYANYWIARRPLWNSYCSFARRTMHLMVSDPQLAEMCMQDASYPGALSPDALVAIGGCPYYTFHPFIMERLPCLFFRLHGARIRIITPFESRHERMNAYCSDSNNTPTHATKSGRGRKVL